MPNFYLSTGHEWVGWQNKTNAPRLVPLELTFEFEGVRNFSRIDVFANNDYNKHIQVGLFAAHAYFPLTLSLLHLYWFCRTQDPNNAHHAQPAKVAGDPRKTPPHIYRLYEALTWKLFLSGFLSIKSQPGARQGGRGNPSCITREV